MSQYPELIKAASEMEEFIGRQMDAIGSHHTAMMLADVLGYSLGNGAETMEQIEEAALLLSVAIRETALRVFLEKGKVAGHA